MGTKIAVTFANIFMGKVESQILQPYQLKHTPLEYINELIIRNNNNNALIFIINLVSDLSHPI